MGVFVKAPGSQAPEAALQTELATGLGEVKRKVPAHKSLLQTPTRLDVNRLMFQELLR